MKLRTLGATAVLGCTLAGAGMSSAQADGGAVVIRNSACTLPDHLGGAFTANPADQFTVITPSGRINHHCHGDLPAGVTPPKRAVHVTSADFGGASCVTPGGGVTTDWRGTITPAGKVRLVCNDA